MNKGVVGYQRGKKVLGIQRQDGNYFSTTIIPFQHKYSKNKNTPKSRNERVDITKLLHSLSLLNLIRQN